MSWMFFSIGILLTSSIGLSCAAQFVQSDCSSRTRKAWGAMTVTEQQVYLDAIALGMSRGYRILFTEMHSEMTSATEFYMTCGFLYWNGRFLLAYENMLRSLGARYACVTIPYWDYFADYASFVDGRCNSIESCSPILKGLAGHTVRSKKLCQRKVYHFKLCE